MKINKRFLIFDAVVHRRSKMLKQIVSLCLTVAFAYSMSIDEAVKYALNHSIAIKQSKTSATITQIEHKISKSEQFGEINLVADYNHYNSPRTLKPLTPSIMQSGVPIPESKDIFSVGILYTVPLFTGYAQLRQIEIDTLSKSIANARLKLTKEEIAYNVRSLYLSVLAQKDMLNAQKVYIKALESLIKDIKMDIKAGKKAPIDSLKSEVELENAKTYAMVLKSNITITKATLWALLGKRIDKFTKVDIDPKSVISKEYRFSIKKLNKIIVEQLNIRKSQKMIEKSEALKLPQVSLQAYAGRNYGDDSTIHHLGWESEDIVQIGVHASYNLFDFGKRSGSIQKAKVAKMQALLKMQQTLLDIKKQISKAKAKIALSFAQYKGSLAQLRLSKKSEKIEEVRYTSGVATINDLLLAKGHTQLAKAKVIEALYNYQKSLYYLDYILERGVKR